MYTAQTTDRPQKANKNLKIKVECENGRKKRKRFPITHLMFRTGQSIKFLFVLYLPGMWLFFCVFFSFSLFPINWIADIVKKKCQTEETDGEWEKGYTHTQNHQKLDGSPLWYGYCREHCFTFYLFVVAVVVGSCFSAKIRRQVMYSIWHCYAPNNDNMEFSWYF